MAPLPDASKLPFGASSRRVAHIIQVAYNVDLFMPSKSAVQTNRQLVELAQTSIERRLPSGWGVKLNGRKRDRLELTSPDGTVGYVEIMPLQRTPRGVWTFVPVSTPTMAVAEWISPRAREILVFCNIGYVDETGNMLLALDKPGLFLRDRGADRDPSPPPGRQPNARGPRAWALQRTLAEVRPPYGLGALAATLGADAGYLSRLLNVLADELLITRAPRGPVENVEWEAMLRHIATSYSMLDANDTTSWIAPGGADQFLRDLSTAKVGRYAVTGSFAASQLVSVAAPEIAVVFIDDPDRLAAATRLRPVRNGGNVVTAIPYDQIVFQRTWSSDNIIYASPAQIVIDCLKGFGRMPSEADALVAWMGKRAPLWQAPTLATVAELP